MVNQYKTTSTSASSADVEDTILSQSDSGITRKIIRPQIVDNPNDNEASVRVTILHQKAISKNEFEDLSEQSLAKLKAKEVVKLSLDAAETKVLFHKLSDLYAIRQEPSVFRGQHKLVVGHEDEVIITDPERAKLIKKLIEQGHSIEVWNQLIETDPDLATRLSQARLQQKRIEVLAAFSAMLKNRHIESEWQNFFEQNTWIFGYGLNYQILRTVSPQPYYGGQTLDGKGANKGDFLQSTQADISFTVLVEIKTPLTSLLEVKPYRAGAYAPSTDLSGGVSQLRINAKNWEILGSRSDANYEQLTKANIFTIKPKTILLIGNTKELEACPDKRTSFELFRQGQNDVEIITFDEVFERAKFIVEHAN